MLRDTRTGSSDAAAWWLLALLALLCTGSAATAGFQVAPLPAVAVVAALALLAAAGVIGHRTDRPRLAVGGTAFLQMSLFTVLGVVLAFALAARAAPLWDPAFAAADRALGFDWPALFRAADRVPVLLWIGGVAYHSLTVQMVVCIVVLSATGQATALRSAVVAAILGGTVTILISGVVPAMGNTFDPADYRHLWPSVAWADRDLIAGLRDGTHRMLRLTHLTGIVSFPSFHATLPVILAWSLRHTRYLRLPFAAWGAVTIAATPLFGGHYAVDVLGGLILAVPVIAVAPHIVRWADGISRQTQWFRLPAPARTRVDIGLRA